MAYAHAWHARTHAGSQVLPTCRRGVLHDLRYMWIPHTDTVVVVTCDPIAEDAAPPSADDKKASRLPRQKTYKIDWREAGLAQPEQEKRPAEGALRRLLVNKSTAAGKPVDKVRAHPPRERRSCACLPTAAHACPQLRMLAHSRALGVPDPNPDP